MEHILILGGGSMGSGMAQLFKEKGSNVSVFDLDKKALQKLADKGVPTYTHLIEFLKSSPSGQPRIIVLSLPHGSTTDKILDQLEPVSNKGDIVLDLNDGKIPSGDKNVAIRQILEMGQFSGLDVAFLVAIKQRVNRHGPSMSPGCTRESYKQVEHLLKEWAAKDSNGKPCVAYIGERGAGHCVKTIHNGIEQGILSAICEVYAIMRHSLGLSNEEIAKIFKEWDARGGLKGNFLVALAAEIPTFAKGDGIENKGGIVDEIEDKVVQDSDDSEGTGTWTQSEWAMRHVSAPTLATAHCLRLVSANRGERLKVAELMKISPPARIEVSDKSALIEDLREALFVTTLACFVQGCNIIARAERDEKWGVNLTDCMKIWRAGCIIQSDAIIDLIQPIYEQDHELVNLALAPEIAKALAAGYPRLKTTVSKAIDADCVIPALSATLEYLKSISGKHLPTNFEEAELDAFGSHAYDVVGEEKLDVKKGGHHTEWRPL